MGEGTLTLRQWLEDSPFEGSPSLLAEYLEIPPKTVEGWLYEGKKPKPPLRWRLYVLTRLDAFAPENGRERAAVAEMRAEEEWRTRSRARQLEEAVEEVWTHLEFFVLSPPERRGVLGDQVGADELEAMGRMFRLLADPEKFSAWRALRALRRRIAATREANGR